LDICKRKGWEVVLATEVRSEQEGVIWIGDGREQTAIIHSTKTAIFLRGNALKRWIEGNQKMHHSERTTTVCFDDIRLVSVYQPLWSNGREGIEQYRHEVEQQVAFSPPRELMVIGGDHNAQIGKGSQRDGIAGRFGLNTRTNEAGEDLLNWCESQAMAYANSFSCHGSRGTWFNRGHRRWYELDGFLLKKEQRHRCEPHICSINEMVWSDHKPMKISVKVKNNGQWRGHEGRKPQINWEKLRERHHREAFEELTQTSYEERRQEFQENSTNWDVITDILTTAVETVCGRKLR
jgi:exonuclease III